MLRGALTGVLSNPKHFPWSKWRNGDKSITGAITALVELLLIHMPRAYLLLARHYKEKLNINNM
jgi:hypothetical protein